MDLKQVWTKLINTYLQSTRLQIVLGAGMCLIGQWMFLLTKPSYEAVLGVVAIMAGGTIIVFAVMPRLLEKERV